MKTYSLTELCRLIEDAISEHMDTTYWVKAEIMDMTIRGGHCYMELADKNDSGSLSAKLRATCWSNIYTMLAAYFQEETGSRLQKGMQILIEVEVSYHTVYGLSLNIINIDPQYTVGGLAKERQRTIAQLQADGVMDLQRSLYLPSLPLRIATISSAHAAGYEDFADQLRNSGYRFRPQLFPAIMQGEHAADSIIDALGQIAMEEEQWDVVVIIRGGGATTDLNCFDDYRLCAHCAQFPLPILSGIGHTKDVSVLDMVAHLALKTPTAVAAYLVEQADRQLTLLTDWRRRLLQTAERQMMVRRHRLEVLRRTLELCSPERIYRQGYSLMRKDGKVVRSIHDLKTGDWVETALADGTIRSEIIP